MTALGFYEFFSLPLYFFLCLPLCVSCRHPLFTFRSLLGHFGTTLAPFRRLWEGILAPFGGTVGQFCHHFEVILASLGTLGRPLAFQRPFWSGFGLRSGAFGVSWGGF